MSEKEHVTKLYYSIGEVADSFGVSKSLIRYWETEFRSLKPHKNSKGERRFTQKNIDQLKLIYHLVKVRGFTLDGAKLEIQELRKRDRSKLEVEKKLAQIKKELLNLKGRIQ